MYCHVKGKDTQGEIEQGRTQSVLQDTVSGLHGVQPAIKSNSSAQQLGSSAASCLLPRHSPVGLETLHQCKDLSIKIQTLE